MNDYEIFYTDKIQDIHGFAQICTTDMFWVIDNQVSPYIDLIEDYMPDDETLIHNFHVITKSGKKLLNGVRLIPKDYDDQHVMGFEEVMGDWKPIQQIRAYTVDEALPQAHNYRFFVVPPDVEEVSVDMDNYCEQYWWHMDQMDYTIYWKEKDTNGTAMGHGGIVLASKNKDPEKFLDDYGSVRKPYDIIFISYNEPFADEHYEALRKRFGDRVKRINGVKGIFQAHKAASMLATTEMFYVVDADAIVHSTFNFDYYPSMWDRDAVHVWRSVNSINGLEYGYGGVKLFPRLAFNDVSDDGVDVTTTVANKFKIMDEVSNTTVIDYDAYTAWKSAFRECCKLSASIIKNADHKENQERLNTWLTSTGGSEYASYVQRGGHLGMEFGKENMDENEMLRLINDYDWIRQKFNEEYDGKTD